MYPSTQKSFLGTCSRSRTSPNGPSQRQHPFLEDDLLQFYDLALNGDPADSKEQDPPYTYPWLKLTPCRLLMATLPSCLVPKLSSVLPRASGTGDIHPTKQDSPTITGTAPGMKATQNTAWVLVFYLCIKWGHPGVAQIPQHGMGTCWGWIGTP